MTEQDKKQLQFEIDCIFESGANEIHIFEMVERFIKQRSLINTLTIANVSEAKVITDNQIEEKSCRTCIFNGQQMIYPGSCTGCGAQEHRNYVHYR